MLAQTAFFLEATGAITWAAALAWALGYVGGRLYAHGYAKGLNYRPPNAEARAPAQQRARSVY